MNNYSILDLHILTSKDCDEMVKLKKKKLYLLTKDHKLWSFLLSYCLKYYDTMIILSFDTN